MRQVAQPQHREADMIKVTSRRNEELILNPARIESVKRIPREVGATILMLSGHRHEVLETVDQVHQQIEDLRHE
jgi:uncharacterized protein YlzI (FlbEa/FlbD family)